RVTVVVQATNTVVDTAALPINHHNLTALLAAYPTLLEVRAGQLGRDRDGVITGLLWMEPACEPARRKCPVKRRDVSHWICPVWIATWGATLDDVLGLAADDAGERRFFDFDR